jgi:hypothetical protein
MMRALERHAAKEARVLPVILHPCDWQTTPFAKLQSATRNATPVSKYPNHHDAFLEIVQAIRAVATQLQAKPGESHQARAHAQGAGEHVATELRSKQDLPILGWITHLLLAGVRFVRDTFRIKDETRVSITTIAQQRGRLPETLCLGLTGTEQTCIVQIPLIIANKGRAPVRNLAVRVLLPRALIPDFQAIQLDPISKGSFHQETVNGHIVQHTYQLPILRIDETVELSVLIRVRPTDWITVKAGGAETSPGFVKIGSRAPIQVVGLNVVAAVHAENIRAVFGRMDIWITPAKNLADLQQKSTNVFMVQRIWRYGASIVRFPLVGSLVFSPWLPWTVHSGALVHLSEGRAIEQAKAARFFDVKATDGFLPVKYGPHILANPGRNRAKFSKWLKRVYETRPPYYR